MKTEVQTLDQLLRARGRAEIDKEVTQRIEKALDYHLANEGIYRPIDISSAGLKITDRGTEHDDEDRYVVVISHKDLLQFLINDALEYHGPIAEQRAVNAFMDRVESVHQDIEDLRNGVDPE